jgi:23S rRNA-/tRNA-specific pseudouridylate synthase
VLIAFNKPFNVLCQFTDSAGRRTLTDFVTAKDVYPAGRLDYDSEGLVLLTDDDALQKRIADPRHRTKKTYLAQVERIPDDKALVRLRGGRKTGGRTRLAVGPRAADTLPARYSRHVAGDHAHRRLQPAGAQHDRGRRSSDPAAGTNQHRRLDAKRPAARRVGSPALG